MGKAPEPDELAKLIFVLTTAAAIVYAAVVFIFIL